MAGSLFRWTGVTTYWAALPLARKNNPAAGPVGCIECKSLKMNGLWWSVRSGLERNTILYHKFVLTFITNV